MLFIKMNNTKEKFKKALGKRINKGAGSYIGSKMNEKLINQLIATSAEENVDKNFINQLEKVKTDISANHTLELEKYRDDVISEIRE